MLVDVDAVADTIRVVVACEFPVACEVAHLYARELHLRHHLHHAVAVTGEMLDTVKRNNRSLALIGKVHLLVVVASHRDGVVFAIALAEQHHVMVVVDCPCAGLIA